MGVKNITSATYTVEINDELLNCNCVANNMDISLSNARNYIHSITIKKVDSTANTLTIHPSSGETIEENATISMTESNEYKTLVPTSNGWIISSSSVDMHLVGDSEILMKNDGNSFIGAGVVLVGDDLESEYSLSLPPNTLKLGDNIAIHENGGFIEYSTETLGKKYILIGSENATTGSLKPLYYSRAVLESDVVLQSNDATLMESVTEINVTPSTNSEISRIYTNFAVALTNLKIKVNVNSNDVAYYPSKVAWDEDEVAGLNLDAGVGYFDLVPHFSFLTSYNVKFYVKADTEIDLMGNGTTPYFAVDRQVITAYEILTVEDISFNDVEEISFLNNANQSIIIGTNSIRNALIIYYFDNTASYEGGQIILASDGTTSEIDAERIGESDVIISDIEFSTAIVDSKLCLNITATGDGSKTVTFKYKVNTIE